MSVLHDSYVWSHPMIHVTQQKLHLLKFLTFCLLHEAVIASRAASSRLRTIRNGLIYLKLIVTGGDDLPQIPCSSHGCGLQCRCRGHMPSVSQSVNQSVRRKQVYTSGYATMVHGRGCNPHRSTTTFAKPEMTSGFAKVVVERCGLHPRP